MCAILQLVSAPSNPIPIVELILMGPGLLGYLQFQKFRKVTKCSFLKTFNLVPLKLSVEPKYYTLIYVSWSPKKLQDKVLIVTKISAFYFTCFLKRQTSDTFNLALTYCTLLLTSFFWRHFF